MNSSRRSTPSGPSVQRLHIIERGARTGLAGCSATGLTVSQEAEEPAAVLAQRVLRQIADSERAQRIIQGATLRAGAQDDSTTAAARRLILLALAAYAASAERSLEITVFAPLHASDRIRLQLLSLVDEVLLAGKGNVAVCLRFGEDELPSVSVDRAARALRSTARAPRRATTTSRGV